MTNSASRFKEQSNNNFIKLLNTKTTIKTLIQKPEPKFLKFNIDDYKFLDDDHIIKYLEFTVEDSGLYNISNQICIQCNNTSLLNILQFGLCRKDFDDSHTVFNSHIINSECNKDNVLSKSFSSMKYLEIDTEYVLWVIINAETNSNFELKGEYSNLQLIRLN